jgi:ADP-heptose:LPS heptosyltransferase
MMSFVRAHDIRLVINFRKEARDRDAHYFDFRSHGEDRGLTFWDLHELSSSDAMLPMGDEMCTVLRRHGLDVAPLQTEWLSRYRSPPSTESIGLFVGASRGVKRWPERGWVTLCSQLLADNGGGDLVVASGPGSAERNLADAVANAPALAGRVKLRSFHEVEELVWWLGGLTALVSCDTAAVHLAVAVGTPVVGLYTATDSRIWRPVTRTPFRAIQSSTAMRCKAMKVDGTCERLYLGCPAPCRAGVTPEAVLVALRSVLMMANGAHR